jgi:hypothetical protein
VSRRFPLLPVLAPLLALAAGLSTPAAQPAVPAPRDVLGFTPGDDYKLADFSQLRDYFQKLAAASRRVQLSVAGTSTEGRDILVAVISSEENLEHLAHYKDIARRLGLVRGLDDATAHELASEGRAIVWIDNGLHASEVATAQHSMQLAWRVATEESREMQEIRDNVILVLLPTINPDGLDLVVDWYRKTLGTPYQDSPMPWLYQKYVGHDNNRDFYMQTQQETRVVNDLLYRDWLPQITYNQHQGTWPPRIFVPPFPDPFNPNIDPLVMRGIDLVGGAMLHRFEREGKDGVISRYEFSTWYDGSIRTTAYFHNMVGILTETGHASATPFTYDPADFPKELDNGVSTREPSTTYPHPWLGGTLHLADAIDYMLTGSLAVLEVAAKYRSQFLYDIYQAGARQIRKGGSEPPVAFVIPAGQHDPPVAARFVETLMRGGVDVDRATADFVADGHPFLEGSWVVRMAQPFRPFALDMLAPQRYPDLRSSPGGPPIPPYDTAGWTLAYQMGVRIVPVDRPFEAPLERLDDFPHIEGKVLSDPDAVRPSTSSGRTAGRPGSYILGPSTNNTFTVVNGLLAAGLQVSRAATRPAPGAPSLARGAFVVRARTVADASRLARDVTKQGVVAVRATGEPRIALPGIRPARIGLYRSWVANIDEGWTRWLLEQYGFPYATLRNEDIRQGGLHGRFDVIILPSQSPQGILEGHQPGPRPKSRPWDPVPPEYRGGIGAEGVAALKAFVEGGGTLVTFDAASDLVLQRFAGIFDRIHDPVATLDRRQFYCPGSVLRVRVDVDAPAAFGMEPDAAAFFADSRGFVTDDPAVAHVVRYAPAADLLMSGWLLGADHLAGLDALLDVPLGHGRVLLFGFRPQFRAQPHGTFKLLFNALYR